MSISKRQARDNPPLHNRGGARPNSGPKPKRAEDRIKPKLLGLSTDNIQKIEGYVEKLAKQQKISHAKVVRIALDLLKLGDLRRALKKEKK